MKRFPASLAAPAAAAAFAFLLAGPPAAAQGTFRLVVDSVTDSRARTSSNDTSGRLTLRPRLEGDGLAQARACRLRVVEASDDTGRPLFPEEPQPAAWETSPSGAGLQILLTSPSRGAATVAVKGVVELWVPSRDRSSRARVEKALGERGFDASLVTTRSVLKVPFELSGVPLP